jgi:hypothetical protein
VLEIDQAGVGLTEAAHVDTLGRGLRACVDMSLYTCVRAERRALTFLWGSAAATPAATSMLTYPPPISTMGSLQGTCRRHHMPQTRRIITATRLESPTHTLSPPSHAHAHCTEAYLPDLLVPLEGTGEGHEAAQVAGVVR